jgi:hypothetical protein
MKHHFIFLLVVCTWFTFEVHGQNFFSKGTSQALLNRNQSDRNYQSFATNFTFDASLEMLTIRIKLDTYIEKQGGPTLMEELSLQGARLLELKIPVSDLQKKQSEKQRRAEVYFGGKKSTQPIRVALDASTKEKVTLRFLELTIPVMDGVSIKDAFLTIRAENQTLQLYNTTP